MKPRMYQKRSLWFVFSKTAKDILIGCDRCPFVAYMNWSELSLKDSEQ